MGRRHDHIVHHPGVVLQNVPRGLQFGERVGLVFGRAAQFHRLVQRIEPPAYRLVLQLVELLQRHTGDDLVAVPRFQHRVEVELGFPEPPRVMLEDTVEEGEEERLEGGDELAKR